MNKELEYLADLKQRICDTSNLSFVAQDFHRASMLSHVIGRIELVEEAMKDYQLKYN